MDCEHNYIVGWTEITVNQGIHSNQNGTSLTMLRYPTLIPTPEKLKLVAYCTRNPLAGYCTGVLCIHQEKTWRNLMIVWKGENINRSSIISLSTTLSRNVLSLRLNLPCRTNLVMRDYKMNAFQVEKKASN